MASIHRASQMQQSTDQLVSPSSAAAIKYPPLTNSQSSFGTELPSPAMNTKSFVQDLESSLSHHPASNYHPKTETLHELKVECKVYDDCKTTVSSTWRPWLSIQSDTQNRQATPLTKTNVHPSSCIKLEYASTTSKTQFDVQNPMTLVHVSKDQPGLVNKPFLMSEKLSKITTANSQGSKSLDNSPNCRARDSDKIKNSSGQTQHICQIPNCGKVFKRISYFKRHVKRHSNEKNFICNHCNKAYVLEDQLRSHVIQHICLIEKRLIKESCTSNRRFDTLQFCPIFNCGKVFGSRDTLKKHLRCHSDEKTFICSHCSKEFLHIESLKNHFKVHMIIKRNELKKGIIDAQIANNNLPTTPFLKAKKITIMDSRSSQSANAHNNSNCIADGSNETKGSKSHLKEHSSQKNFVCARCGKAFAYKRGLSRHRANLVCFKENEQERKRRSGTLRSHSDEKNFVCRESKKEFAHVELLDCHLQVHVNAKQSEPKNDSVNGQIAENSVPSKATSSETLAVRNQPVCPVAGCGRTYEHLGHLSAHLSSYHSVKRYACTFCDNKFWQERHLRRHVRVLHTNTCTFCHTRFRSFDYLKLHVDRVHRNPIRIVPNIKNDSDL